MKMTQKTKRIITIVALLIWDVISVAAATFLAFRVNYAGNYEVWGVWYNPLSWVPGDVYRSNLWLFIALCSAAMLLLNLLFRNYTSMLRHLGVGEIIRIVCACFVFSVALYFASFALDYFEFGYIVIYCLMLTAFQVVGRSSVKLINETRAKVIALNRSKSCDVVRTLIFGAGEAGAYFCQKEKSDIASRVLPVVFIDDNKQLQKSRVHGVKVYGGIERLSEAIERFNIDEVIVAIPTASKQLLNSTMEICKKHRCKIRRFGNIDDIEMSKVSVTNINIEELLRRDSVKLNMDTVRDFVEDKVIVVTGGAGSIGSEICRQVLQFGCRQLIIFDIHENGLFEIENELRGEYEDRICMRLGSVRDMKRLNEVFDEFSPQLVFHAAAHKHVPMMEYSPREAIKNNVKGTINVANAAVLHRVEKFILISTDKAVNPTNIMGASKRIAELAIQLFDTLSDTDFSAVRFGNVLGSNGSVVPTFRRQIEAGGPVTVTHPEMARYFMTIPEAVQLVLEAGALANGGEIFVLNMGEPVKIYDLACDLIRLSGYEPEVDIPIIFTGFRPGEKLVEELNIKDEDMERTPNDKIYIMKPMSFDATQLAAQIKQLEQVAVESEISEMFEKVRELVPTFEHDPNHGADNVKGIM